MKNIILVTFISFVSGSLGALAISHFKEEKVEEKIYGVVDLKNIVAKQSIAWSAEKKSKEEVERLSRNYFEKDIKEAFKQLPENVVIFSKPAVLTPMTDYTENLSDYLGLGAEKIKESIDKNERKEENHDHSIQE